MLVSGSCRAGDRADSADGDVAAIVDQGFNVWQRRKTIAYGTCLLDLDLVLVEVAWQQCLDGISGFSLWQFREQIAEIGVGFQSVGFRGLDQRVQIGTGFHSLGRVTEQPVFLPMTKGRMAFSAALLSISRRPSSK